MSTNGINNLNKAEIAKLALAQKSGKTAATQQPEHMTKNGSIFKAPETKQTENPKSASELKSLDTKNLKTKSQCEQALKDIETASQQNPIIAAVLKGKAKEITQKKNELSRQATTQNLNNIANGTVTKQTAQSTQSAEGNDNQKQLEAQQKAKNISASEGKKMAADMDSTSRDVENKKTETEQNTKKADKYASNAQKDQKQLVKQQKSLQQQQKAFTKDIQENQKEISTLTEEMEQMDVERKALADELESLTGGDNTGVGVNSAFSLKLAGSEEYDKALQAEDPNAARIADIQSQLTEKTATMTTTGQRIGKLQTATNKQIKTMHKVSVRYMAGVNRTQKNLEENQSTTQKILKVANKIDEISTTVKQAGQTLDYTGKALVALGSSTSWCFGAGAALISAGTIMQKAGNIAIVAGNYGSLAANVTKTACYAAEGNLTGALTSAASALQSGQGAVKGTKQMGNTFAKIDEQAKAATEKLQDKVAEKAAEKAAEEAAKKGAEEAANAATNAATDTVTDTTTKGMDGALKQTSNGIKEGMTVNDPTKGMPGSGLKDGLNTATTGIKDAPTGALKQTTNGIKDAMTTPDLKTIKLPKANTKSLKGAINVAAAKVKQEVKENGVSFLSKGLTEAAKIFDDGKANQPAKPTNTGSKKAMRVPDYNTFYKIENQRLARQNAHFNRMYA